MDKSRINDMVDRKIIEAFKEGISVGAIQSDLKVRIKNFIKTITNDTSVVYDDLYKADFNDIKIVRHRYGITYIKQCEKRIKDLDWILKEKPKFRHYSNSNLFNLIKFKDKISKDNAVQIAF
jgi:hypothetical protein